MLYGFRALRFVCLNVVRSGRPEQSGPLEVHLRFVMPRPSQCSPVWKTGTITHWTPSPSTHPFGLNVVRSGRPEQFWEQRAQPGKEVMSQCSPVWKTGTIRKAAIAEKAYAEAVVSM
mgnify:CR=1 FL=1